MQLKMGATLSTAHRDDYEDFAPLQGLNWSQPVEEVIKASLPCVKRAHTKYLKPKESYSKTVVDHCQQRLMFAKTLNRAEDLTIQAELNEVSKYLHASNVTFLHMLMNISGQPYEPQTLQVVEALALELVFNEQVTKSFLSDYHKMMDVREELKPSCSLRTPNYVQLMTVKKVSEHPKWLCFEAPGTGKALAAIYSAIYLQSPYTCVFAENATHSRLKEEIRSVDKTAWVISTAISGIKEACAELESCYNASIEAGCSANDPKEGGHRTYLLIQREVIQQGSMMPLYPAKTQEHSTVSGKSDGRSSNESAGPAENVEVEATQALGLLKRLDEANLLKLVVVDELHMYLGKAAHTETVSNVLGALTSAKLLGMTGTPIGKTQGLKDCETIAALFRLPVHTQVKRPPYSKGEQAKKDAWEIMETHRFFVQHSITLTFPTPLPMIKKIHLKPDSELAKIVPKLTGLEYEEAVKGIKTKGLSRLVQAGLQADQQVALFCEYIGSKGSLRNFQRVAAFEALQGDMDGLREDQVQILDTKNIDSVLQKAKVIIYGKAASVGLDGLQGIKQVVYLCPPTWCHIRQQLGRHDRPASRVAGEAPLSVFALCVEQEGTLSREEKALHSAQKADELATAALYGLADLMPNTAIPSQYLDQLPRYVPQPDEPQVLHGPPKCNPKKCRSGGGSSSSGHWTPPPKGSQSDPSCNEDLLACLVPTADADAHDEGKHSPELTEEQLRLLDYVTSAAQDILKTNPHGVLERWLKVLTRPGKESLALATCPHILAICSHNCQQLQHRWAAIDIEKFTSVKGIETWTQYAIRAAQGMDSVIPVAEIGYFTKAAAKAWKISATLKRKQEAMSGLTDTGEASKQFRGDKKAKNVNKAVVTNAEDPSREPSEVETAWLAYQQCMADIDDKLVFAHNSTGYDERALFKILLLKMAGLHQGHQKAAEEVWQAARQLLDGGGVEKIPPFLPVYQPVRQLLNVLWDMLKESPQHKVLIQDAEQAGLKKIPGRLTQAFKVFCGHAVEPKHWSDIDSQHLFHIVVKLLTGTFASAPCIDLLDRHGRWLRCNADVIQDQLSSVIKQLRSRVDLGFDSCSPHLAPEDSYDPVTLVLLESKRKAFQMLVNLSNGAGSVAPVSPSPAKGTKRGFEDTDKAEKSCKLKMWKHASGAPGSSKQGSGDLEKDIIDLTSG